MQRVNSIQGILQRSSEIETELNERRSNGESGLDLILDKQSDICILYSDITESLRRKLPCQDFDDLHDVINKWDSLYSYYNLDVGHVKIKKDRSFNPESLVRANFNKYIKGTVVKVAMDKTVTLLVERRVIHHPTGKRLLRSSKYLVHDPEELCNVGDEILAVETRPISKRKNHVFYRKILS